jgi:8-oxo-dGTP diphosphatase
MKPYMGCSEALAAPKPDMPNLPIVLVAAAAILDRKNNVLIAQRPEGKDMAGLWEFPGGKIQPGEVPEYALMRELEEELGIETRPCCMSAVGFASHTYPTFHLLMPLYAVRVWKGEPQSREGQALKWMKIQDLYGLAMPEADKPLIPQLEASL